MNILLVDDQPAGLIALEAVLESLGQTLVKARSGAEALRHVLSIDFAVILLDIQMPGIDGLETAELIRARDRSRDTPIIFVTAGSSNDTEIIRGYAVGAVDYVLKPLVPAILRSKVAVFVELAKNAELLRAARDSTERANKELEAFSAAVSHDLRAPLRSIDGFSQILLEEHADRLDETGQGYLRRIRASTGRMAELIDDLLELSRVTRSELVREPLDVTGMANDLLAQLQSAETSRAVELRVESGLLAEGDRSLMRVVLSNLLANAWKFTGKRARGSIEVGAMPGAGVRTFFVRDDGAGFDMCHAKRLFEPFQRLHSIADFEGTGVGLATAQRIVERHGGRIWAEGKVGAGATFYFTLTAGSA